MSISFEIFQVLYLRKSNIIHTSVFDSTRVGATSPEYLSLIDRKIKINTVRRNINWYFCAFLQRHWKRMNTQMLIKSINHRLSCLLIISKRSGIIQTKVDLGLKLKLLNEKEQYREVLELFDKYKDKNILKFSSLAITQTLKACTHLGELQRGSTIHQLLSSRVDNDVYIQVTLIHLYSKLKKRFFYSTFSNWINSAMQWSNTSWITI